MAATEPVATMIEARAALAANPASKGQELWSPPDGASVQGVLWFVALQQALDRDFPDRAARIVLDCGSRADLAIEALRHGIGIVALAATPEIAAKVADIAKQLDGRVIAQPVT